MDDSHSKTKLMQRLLKSVNANVITASSADEALEILHIHSFTLIILDIQRPTMNGVELAESIRNLEQIKSIPILFISAVYTSGEVLAKGGQAGVIDYMTKPVDWPVFINKVEVLVKQDQKKNLVVDEDLHQGHIQEKKFAEQDLLQITLESIGEAVITTDKECIITYINPVAESLTGWKNKEAKNRKLTDVFKIVYENSDDMAHCPMEGCLREGKIVNLMNSIDLVSLSNKHYSIQGSASPFHNKQQQLLGGVLIFSDVTQSRRLTCDLVYQASHDPLTGLINRREFELRLNRVVESVKNRGDRHVLCYLDLDKFKKINESCGHSAGDQLLKKISHVLSGLIRSRDSLGRLGGDEFAIIMEHCSIDEAKSAAENIRKVIADFQFNYNDNLYKVEVSIGLCPITQHINNLEELLMFADTACYTAKRQGRNQVVIYEDHDTSEIQQHDEIQYVSLIHDALETNSFELFYQYIRSCQTEEQHSLEVLIRLRDETGKLILPGLFLPVAEHYDLIGHIDKWVVEHVFQWMYERPEYLNKLAKVAINLSGMTIGNRNFLTFIVNLLDKYQLPTEKICFEITETAMTNRISKAKYFIDVLRKKGCQFALDDFGIGLSSFSYLKNLPVEYVKIDGSFVKNMLEDPVDFELVSSINDIGHVLGKKTVAEFVESEELLKSLQEMGVDYVQGYVIGKPQPIDEIKV